MAILIIGIIILIIVINVSSNNRRQREEAERQAKLRQQRAEVERQARLKREREETERQARLRQQRAEEERRARLRREKEAAEKKQKEDEIRRLDELKNETIVVVYESVDDNNKPRAIVKRSNNTYASIERPSGRFKISETIRIAKEKINSWNWYNETTYKRELAERQQADLLREQILKKQKREEAEKQAKLRQQREEEARQAKAELERLLIKKYNWQEFQQVLQRNNVITLYHFTDRANISSIKKYGGLYSWDYCEKNGIIIPYQGGGSLSRDLDKRYSLQDYVRVSFTRNHPMLFVAQNEGRIINPAILTISLEVCYFQETRFSNMNATKTGHKQGKNLEDLQSIHFNTVRQINHFDLEETEKPYFQAEVLVKTWIPIRYITNINDF